MGNSSSNPVKNMDKRTSRREYKSDFEGCIASYRSEVAIAREVSRSNGSTFEARVMNDGLSLFIKKYNDATILPNLSLF